MKDINSTFVGVATIAGFLLPVQISNDSIDFLPFEFTIEREKADKNARIFAENANLNLLKDRSIFLTRAILTILRLNNELWYPAYVNSKDIYPIKTINDRDIGFVQDKKSFHSA